MYFTCKTAAFVQIDGCSPNAKRDERAGLKMNGGRGGWARRRRERHWRGSANKQTPLMLVTQCETIGHLRLVENSYPLSPNDFSRSRTAAFAMAFITLLFFFRVRELCISKFDELNCSFYLK